MGGLPQGNCYSVVPKSKASHTLVLKSVAQHVWGTQKNCKARKRIRIGLMGSVPCSAVRCFRNSLLISAYGSFVPDWTSISTLCCSQAQSDVVFLVLAWGVTIRIRRIARVKNNSKNTSKK